ncbi:peptide deformylase [Streptomyces sp. NBC_00096]|uniref:peptide deformylase n=1 Tax=Streptomyces sp. NBC_00096 TaxID=2975650 RepID=UPI0032564E97
MAGTEENAETAAAVYVQGRPVDSYPVLPPGAFDATVRRITVTGEEVLHRPCREVVEFGTVELASLIDDMFITMHIAQGAGLAANQVGADLRVFVFDCVDDDGVRNVGHLCNPVIDTSATAPRNLIEHTEGCLSVPGAESVMARPDRVSVHGTDMDGRPLVIEGTGYFARCLEHEVDHLNGIIYLDRMSRKERRRVLREMAEHREEVFEARRTRAARLTDRP